MLTEKLRRRVGRDKPGAGPIGVVIGVSIVRIENDQLRVPFRHVDINTFVGLEPVMIPLK